VSKPVFAVGQPKDKEKVLIHLARPHFLAYGVCENVPKVTGWMRKQGEKRWKKGKRVRRLNPDPSLPLRGPWAVQFDLRGLGEEDIGARNKYEFCVSADDGSTQPTNGSAPVVFTFQKAPAGKKTAKAVAGGPTPKDLGDFRIAIPLASATPTICPHFWVHGSSSGNSAVTVEVREGATLLTSVTANSTGTLWQAEVTVAAGNNRTIHAFDDDGSDSQGTFTTACAQCPDPTNCV
jgi:hypothetical protein